MKKGGGYRLQLQRIQKCTKIRKTLQESSKGIREGRPHGKPEINNPEKTKIQTYLTYTLSSRGKKFDYIKFGQLKILKTLLGDCQCDSIIEMQVLLGKNAEKIYGITNPSEVTGA